MGPWSQWRRLPFGHPGEQERASKRSETIQPACRSVTMSPLWVFGISIAFSLIAWGIVVMRHWWPDLRRLPRAEALRPLLLLHAFRFVGLSFLVPGVVSLDLPAAWARPAAYGDLIAAALALLALVALRSRLGLPMVWLFNVWGSADLLYAFYQGNRVGLEPGHLGAAFYIVTVLVPLLLITHVVVFRLLLRSDLEVARPEGSHS